MLSLKLPISGIKVVGFLHCLPKNSVVSVDSNLEFILKIALGGIPAAEDGGESILVIQRYCLEMH